MKNINFIPRGFVNLSSMLGEVARHWYQEEWYSSRQNINDKQEFLKSISNGRSFDTFDEWSEEDKIQFQMCEQELKIIEENTKFEQNLLRSRCEQDVMQSLYNGSIPAYLFIEGEDPKPVPARFWSSFDGREFLRDKYIRYKFVDAEFKVFHATIITQDIAIKQFIVSGLAYIKEGKRKPVWGPYLSFMIWAERELEINPYHPRPLKKQIMAWLDENWWSELGENSEKKRDAIATLLRYPEDEKGSADKIDHVPRSITGKTATEGLKAPRLPPPGAKPLQAG